MGANGTADSLSTQGVTITPAKSTAADNSVPGLPPLSSSSGPSSASAHDPNDPFAEFFKSAGQSGASSKADPMIGL